MEVPPASTLITNDLRETGGGTSTSGVQVSTVTSLLPCINYSVGEH